PIAEHPLCGPYRKPQLQQAPTKRDPSSSASRASIKALMNPRNDRDEQIAAMDSQLHWTLSRFCSIAWFGGR
ncbi:MAG: hypothetical protein ACK6DN_13100, partial [Planctomycetota bacterium]